MKFAEIRGKLALIALVAVCLLAVPALSMHMDDNPGRFGQGSMFAMKNNLTQEEMDNMTLGELKEMQKQAWNNTAACNASACPLKGEMEKMNDNSSRCDKVPRSMARASPVLLLMDDLTVEDLGNMTLNEIKALAQEKMQDLNNMTLSEVRQLEETRISERDNMTLSQLKEENKNMRQMARIIGWAGSEHHFRD
jgi:hypothetical protein